MNKARSLDLKESSLWEKRDVGTVDDENRSGQLY